jgi:fumarate hydratase class II
MALKLDNVHVSQRERSATEVDRLVTEVNNKLGYDLCLSTAAQAGQDKQSLSLQDN